MAKSVHPRAQPEAQRAVELRSPSGPSPNLKRIGLNYRPARSQYPMLAASLSRSSADPSALERLFSTPILQQIVVAAKR
jgi:hypothetical protein